MSANDKAAATYHPHVVLLDTEPEQRWWSRTDGLHTRRLGATIEADGMVRVAPEILAHMLEDAGWTPCQPPEQIR